MSNETIKDITKMLREVTSFQDNAGGCASRIFLRDWADRIEAAAERERAEHGHREYDHGYATGVRHGREDAGNSAAMREALEEISRAIDAIPAMLDDPADDAPNAIRRWAGTMRELLRAALAEPARNCDKFAGCNAAWKAYNAIANRERLPGFDFWLFDKAKGGEA